MIRNGQFLLADGDGMSFADQCICWLDQSVHNKERPPLPALLCLSSASATEPLDHHPDPATLIYNIKKYIFGVVHESREMGK